MTTAAQLRKAALGLPETEEATHFGMLAFAVRGNGFASVTRDGRVQLQLSDDDAGAALAGHPTAERHVAGLAVALSVGGPACRRVARPTAPTWLIELTGLTGPADASPHLRPAP